MSASVRNWLFLAGAAWAGAAVGRCDGAGPPALLGLAGVLVAGLACRRTRSAALWVCAAGFLFAGLSRLDAAAPGGNSTSRVSGRLADIAPANGGFVLTLETARGARERVLVPRTGDALLDARPPGLELGAVVATRVKAGLPGAAWRRGLSFSAIDVTRPADFWSRLLTLPACLRGGFRERAAERLAPERDGIGAFLVAAVSGDDRFLDRGVWEALRTSGLAHIAVVSGFNVALLALLIGRGVGRIFGRLHPVRSAVVFAAVLVSAMILPLDPPVQRASAALLAAGAGQLFRRGAPPSAALSAAVTVLLLVDPALATSLSFLLTVAATAAIILAGRAPGWWGTAWTFAGPTFATWPILVEATNRVSPWALAANLAALPAAPVAIGAAWVATLLPAEWGVAVALASAAARASARWILTVADTVAVWPGSGAIAGAGGAIWAALTLVLFVVVVHLRGAAPRAGGVLLLASVASWPLLAPSASPRAPELVLLDVGQGQATLVRAGAEAVLVDSGDDRARSGTRAALRQLRRLRIRRVALLVLSHPDRDHAGGALLALTAMRPRAVALPAASFAAPAFEPVRREAARRGVPVVALAAGDGWERGGVAIRTLHPAPGPPTNSNDDSLVLQIQARDLTALIPGDAGVPVERELAARGMLPEVDVLVAGHHGARSCTSAVLLDAVRPAVVLVSAGAGARYGHPHPETLERLAGARLRPLTTAVWGRLAAGRLTHDLLVVRAGAGGPAAICRRRRDVRRR